ncbi:hypothetical protein WH47_05759 [Habropoda laboriosa]|uniref:Uncharacterized protein n=1 Tax=Habropoda laboriosa TaxID=597456 RepID=A0A0L7QSJ5_9HYME|nr:hypothetical protein WH47_05759 [Habropoda laboriosa]
MKQKIEERKQSLKEERERKLQLSRRTVDPGISYSAMLTGKRPQRHTDTRTNAQANNTQNTQKATTNTHHPTLLEEIKTITNSINNQMARIAEAVELNTNRINFIVETLGIDF